MGISEFQFNEMLTRMGARVKQDVPEAAVEKESELHEFVRSECARRGWIGFHGSMAHRTHRTIGEPDWIILANKGRLILLELKGSKTKVSPEQLALKIWAETLQHVIYIVRSKEEVIQIFSSAD